jgi:hypothetical protein
MPKEKLSCFLLEKRNRTRSMEISSPMNANGYGASPTNFKNTTIHSRSMITGGDMNYSDRSFRSNHEKYENEQHKSELKPIVPNI